MTECSLAVMGFTRRDLIVGASALAAAVASGSVDAQSATNAHPIVGIVSQEPGAERFASLAQLKGVEVLRLPSWGALADHLAADAGSGGLDAALVPEGWLANAQAFVCGAAIERTLRLGASKKLRGSTRSVPVKVACAVPPVRSGVWLADVARAAGVAFSAVGLIETPPSSLVAGLHSGCFDFVYADEDTVSKLESADIVDALDTVVCDRLIVVRRSTVMCAAPNDRGGSAWHMP